MKQFRKIITQIRWWIGILLIIFQLTRVTANCNDDQFKCNNGNCIDSREYQCNGIDDCGSGTKEDENDCSCSDSGIFTCKDDACISQVFLCDGDKQCKDGEDENPENCPTTTVIPITTEKNSTLTSVTTTEGKTITMSSSTTEIPTTTSTTTTEKLTTTTSTTTTTTEEPTTTTTTTPKPVTTTSTTTTTTEEPTTTTTTTPKPMTTTSTTTTTTEEPTTTTTTTPKPVTTTSTTTTTTEEPTTITITTTTTTPKPTTTTSTATTTTAEPTTTTATTPKPTTTTSTTTTTTEKTTTTTATTTTTTTKKPKTTKKPAITTKKPMKKTTPTIKKPTTTTKLTTTIKPSTKALESTTTTTTTTTTSTTLRPISPCDPRGTLRQHPDGRCECKDQKTGDQCDRCSSNSFSSNSNCILCFCNGVSQNCTSSSLFRDTTRATFIPNRHEFALITDFESPQKSDLEVSTLNNEVSIRNLAGDPDVYFWRLPSRFAGNKITSYGGNLKYTVRYVPMPGGIMSRNNAPDVVIRSLNDITILHYRRDNVAPRVSQSYVVPLLEENWQRIDGHTINREHLLMTLADVSDIFIKATYTTMTDEAALSSAVLDTASQYYTGNPALATEVEQCTCPPGYQGSSCEDCAPGYKRSDGLYLGLCNPCGCNGHSDECDAETGVCQNCRDNTEGDYCDVPKRRLPPTHSPRPKHEAPVIKIQPVHSVTVGRSVQLSCQILAGSPTPTVFWARRDRKPLLQYTKQTYKGSNLISVDYHIANITINDEGEYECKAWNKFGLMIQTVAIHVRQPPIIYISPNTSELSVIEGEELQLKCCAEGFPSPFVQWTRSNRKRRGTKTNLLAHNLIRIYKVDRRDEGIYVCHAQNNAGEDQKSIIVRVETRRMDVDKNTNVIGDSLTQVNRSSSLSRHHSKQYNVTEGQTTKMACEISLKNKPIYWRRFDGQPFPSNHKQIGRDLIIYNTQKSAAGIYVCIVHELRTQNEMFAAELFVLDHVDSKGHVQREVHEGGKIVLECGKPTSINDKFHWKREGNKLPSKARFEYYNSRLNLDNIRSHDTGRYICQKIDSNGHKTTNYFDVRLKRDNLRHRKIRHMHRKVHIPME